MPALREFVVHDVRKASYKRLNRGQLLQLYNELKDEQANRSNKASINKNVYRSPAQIYEDTHANYGYNHHDFKLSSDSSLAPLNNRVIRNTQSQFNYWTLQDINKDRKAYHLNPLTPSYVLNHLAQIRANQIQHNFAHYNHSGVSYDALDASKVGLTPLTSCLVAENIEGGQLGYSYQEDDPTQYYSRNGHDLADEDENSMVNYDNDGGGHRQNILDRTSNYVGIASTYDKKDNNFYLAEEFA